MKKLCILRKGKTIFFWNPYVLGQGHIRARVHLGMGARTGMQSGRYCKGWEEIWGDDGYDHCLNSVDGFMAVYICPTFSKFTF